jgi:acyl-CoA thioesterase-2
VAEALERLLHRLALQEGPSTETTTDWMGEAGTNALNMNNQLFGGMVVAQAIVAAGRTDPERTIHSAQQVFLRPGRADVGLCYRVVRVFDGRTYSGLRVDVIQEGPVTIAHAFIGSTRHIDGPERQDPSPPRTPIEATVNRDEHRQRPGWEDQPVTLRIDPDVDDSSEPDQQILLKPAGPMPKDPLLHQAVLGYATDRTFMQVAWKPHRDSGEFRGSTLDHTIWFHRPVTFEDWHTHTTHSPTISAGRGLVHGQVHDPEGVLVASTAQQGTFRSTPTSDPA